MYRTIIHCCWCIALIAFIVFVVVFYGVLVVWFFHFLALVIVRSFVCFCLNGDDGADDAVEVQ